MLCDMAERYSRDEISAHVFLMHAAFASHRLEMQGDERADVLRHWLRSSLPSTPVADTICFFVLVEGNI